MKKNGPDEFIIDWSAIIYPKFKKVCGELGV